MTAILTGLSRWTDRMARAAAAFSLVIMVVLLAIQVVARYLLSDPPAWTEEGARYAMIWAGLLGATMAFRAGTDPVLISLPALQQGRPALAARLLRAIAVLLFLAPVWWFSLFGPHADLARGFIARSAARETESMGLSLAWFTVALPLAISIIVIHLLAGFAARDAGDHSSDGPL